MIIEPCCCHNQLPSLCRDNVNRIVPFNTNGDVTIEKLFHAVAYLTGDAKMTLITPSLHPHCVTYLKSAYSKRWITELRLMIGTDVNIDGFRMGDLEKVVDKRVTESSSMFILEGEKMRICLTGYFPSVSPADTDNRYRMVNHTLLYTTSEPPLSLIWDELVKIAISPFRLCQRRFHQ